MSDIEIDLSPLLLVHKDGRVQRLLGTETVPPCLDDPKTGVQSKDDVYSREANLSCRVYLPKGIKPGEKIPVLVYFHGGGWCVESPFSPTYHNYLNTLVVEAKVLAVSVDYRLAPEHPLPVSYNDSWAALQWVASHASGNGPEEWLNSHAALGRVFLAGDSAGGNITYHMAMRNGQEKLAGINLAGIALVHAHFWGKDRLGSESRDPKRKELIEKVWLFACPTTSGLDDPWVNPIADPNLPRLGCSSVLIFVAEEDLLKDRGWLYYDALRNSEWGGQVEIMESKGENHNFHLANPESDNSKDMLKKFVSFLNQ